MNRQDKQAIREGRIGAKIQQNNIDNQYRSYRRDKFNHLKNGFTLVFGLLLVVLLVVNVIKLARGGSAVSFTGFLNFLSNLEVGFTIPNLDYLINLFRIGGEWAILDGFRVFLNSLGSIFAIVAYICSNIAYSVTFLGKFLIFLLG